MAQQLQIDISGRGGLGGDWYGYGDQTVPTPNMSYTGNDGEMVGGFFNPFTRPGYLFPSVSTLTDLTSSVSTTLTTTLGASVAWMATGISIRPVASSTPTMNGSASSIVEDASDTSLTLSHTIASSLSNSCLVIVVTSKTGSSPTSVTWDGTTVFNYVKETSGGYISYWYLPDPDSGTHDIVVTWGSAVAEKAIHAITLTGVDQSVSFEAYDTDFTTSTTASVTVTPTKINCLCMMATISANATHAQGAGQTERTDVVSTVTPYRYSTSTIDANDRVLTTSSVYDIKNNDYYLADEQRIFKGDGLDDTSLTTVLELGPTDTPVIMDMEIYQVNGVEKLFYVYETGGNLEVGIGALPYSDATDDPTWLTGTVLNAFTESTTSDYNFMRIADNSYAYIFADNAIHKVDGTTDGGVNGTVTEDAYILPIFYRIYDAIDSRGSMYIVVHQSTKDITTINNTATNHSTPCGYISGPEF